jgi:hypothetical protein
MTTREDDETRAVDRIVLTIPGDAGFRGVATLVLGGIGGRLDLPYERLDDLHLAVLSVLDATDGGEICIEACAEELVLSVSIGPLREGGSEDPGLARVLSRLVDGVRPERREGAEWLTLRLARPGSTDTSPT